MNTSICVEPSLKDEPERGDRSRGLDEPLVIGGLELPGRWLLAPLAGVSDWPFRTLALEHGAALAITEMVSSEGLVRGGKATLRLLERTPEERVFAPQIFGADPEVMARAARLVEDMGASLVDLNMGCPVKKVCRSGAGAALLREPRRVEAVVAKVVDSVGIPVQVKVRTGWDSDSVNVLEIADILERAGAASVVVHGRTRAQGYSGRASWDLIAEVKRSVSRMTVIGNGDVIDPRDAVYKLTAYGVDAVMIGRGAWGYPWIFREIASLFHHSKPLSPPSYCEWRRAIEAHLGRLISYLDGDSLRAVRVFRKHLAWYTRGLRGALTFRSELVRLRTPGEVLKALDRHFTREDLRARAASRTLSDLPDTGEG